MSIMACRAIYAKKKREREVKQVHAELIEAEHAPIVGCLRLIVKENKSNTTRL